MVGIPEKKKPLERPKHGWDTKMGLKSTLGCHGLDSSGSRYEQVAGACEHGNDRAYKMQGIFREDILLCSINSIIKASILFIR